MKIAVVCTDLGVRVPGEKGASVHLTAIAQALKGVGHDVMLIGVAGHDAPPADLPSVLFSHPGRSQGLERERRKLAFTDCVRRAASPALDAFAPDVVYERLALFGTAGAALAAERGALHVVEVNALLAREDAAWRGLHLRVEAERREAEVLRGAGLRVAVSEEVAAAVRQVAPGRPTVVVTNGVETERFADMAPAPMARRAMGFAPTGPLVCFVGTLRPWHGLDVAITALAAMADDVTLAVAGDGPIRPALEALAGDLGVSGQVRWLGHLAHDDVPTLLAAADVAVAPYPALTDFSFSPLKLYEYLAAGVPIVASDAGQVRSILADGRYGRLVAPGDAGRLANALTLVLDHPEPARAAAAEGRRHALLEHGWQRRAGLITTLIEGLPNRALAR